MTLPFAQRMERMQRSTIREILKITARKDVISFAGGLPAPELFPLKAFAEAIARAFREDGAACLQYDVTEGYRPLKEFLCQWLAKQGIRCIPDHLMLTSGSQQALDLLGKIFIDPNDTILVETPTYLGMIQAFNAYQARFRSVPIDGDGPVITELTHALKKQVPKLAYVVPTFQNPSGATMSLARRRAFLKEMQARRIPVIEDDPYGALRFTGQRLPSLYELSHGRGVIYLTTFSKILSPGIRLGVVVAEPPVINALVLAKQAADLQPNTLIQRAVLHYGKNGALEEHIPRIIAAYRKRADCMLTAMRRHFPSSVQWVEPQGGMFIWCRLLERWSAARLFKKAIENKVAFVDGAVFHANGGGGNTLRLNFTNSSEAQIEEGIKRLGKVFETAQAGV